MAGGLDFKRAMGAIDMPLERYMLLFVLPTALGTVLVPALLMILLPSVFSGLLAWAMWLIPVVGVGFVIYYPFSVASKRSHLIDHNMHYFITHLGVLATSQVPPVELFRILGEKEKEYGPLAEECKKVAMLVQRWNMSLAEAARFVARRTPSILFADFLERFAFAVESGAEMGPYLVAEQEVVMSDYETVYKATLLNIDGVRDMFTNLMMSVVFLIIFAMLMPVLIGGSATTVFLGVIGLTVLTEVAILFMIVQKVPPDPVWSTTDTTSPLWHRVRYVLPVAAVLSTAIAPILLLLTSWPLALIIALASTPLIVPGYLAGIEEGFVKRRDDNYPAFVRSLGTSAAARGGDEREVLRHLRYHDFGPLTNNIRNLFTRLQLRVDDEAAWMYFTTESGSRLIERFTRMYDEGVDAGGEPDSMGKIISDNMVRIIGLRKLRYQQAGSFRGSLISVAGASAFAVFLGFGVMAMLVGFFSQITVPEDSLVSVPQVIYTEGVNLPQLEILGLLLLLINAGMYAVMIRLVDGGAIIRGLQDFTIMVWVSNMTALGSLKVMSGLNLSGVG